jgi:hypothetical protein
MIEKAHKKGMIERNVENMHRKYREKDLQEKENGPS